MIRRLSVYLLLGLAAGLLLFFFTQRTATNLKASLQTLQEQSQEQLEEQLNWEYENVNKREIEQEETYQYQLNLIEGYADIVTEREADYLETMGHHSPEIREQFPHVTQVELWDAVYEKELEHLDTFGRVSQRVVDQLIESREKAEAIERLFGDLKEQSQCQ